MCNRVGTEGEMRFAGESLVIHPSGKVLVKAHDTEQLLICDIDLQEVQKIPPDHKPGGIVVSFDYH